MGHLVENDVDTLHEERIHLVGTNYIGYIDVQDKSRIRLGFSLRKANFYAWVCLKEKGFQGNYLDT